MPTLTNEIMRQTIMDHYSHPANKRQPNSDKYLTTHMHSDNCIDDIDVFFLVEEDKITDACFDGIGCAISTSSTDIMCDLFIGKTLKEAEYIIEQYMHMVHEEEFDDEVLDEAIVFINTAKQAARIRCATIGYNAAIKILGK